MSTLTPTTTTTTSASAATTNTTPLPHNSKSNTKVVDKACRVCNGFGDMYAKMKSSPNSSGSDAGASIPGKNK